MYDIIIVSVFYNRASMVSKSVGSVLGQIDSEINSLFIAVDDGSTDYTYNELCKFSDRNNYLLLKQENKGFVNTMIDVINAYPSKYIAVHGSGDISLPGRFYEQKKFLDNYNDVVCVGCRIKKVYPDNSFDIAGDFFIEDYKELIISHNPYSHGEVMIRRSAYDSVGGYDEFFKYAQDRDLWCRLSLTGKFASLNEVFYERFVAVPGSVSGDLNKTLLQRYLSNYATFIHERKLNKKSVTDFGEHNVFLFQNSTVLKDIERIFYSKLFRRRYNEAYFFFDHYQSNGGSKVKSLIMNISFTILKLFKIKIK